MKTLAILLFVTGLAACGHKSQPPAPAAANATSSIQEETVGAIPDANEPEPPIPNDGPVPPM